MGEAASDARRRNVEEMLLQLLYDKRREGLPTLEGIAPREFRERYRTFYGYDQATDADVLVAFRSMLVELREQGLVTAEPRAAGEQRVAISNDGVRRLGRLKSSSIEDVGHIHRIVYDEVADLRDILDEIRAEQARLGHGLATFDERVAAQETRLDERSAAVQALVDQRLRDADTRLAQTERRLAGQTIVVLSIFAAIIALVLASAQVVTRVVSPAPWQTFLQSVAVMAPVTVALLLLVGAAWLTTKLTIQRPPP